MTEKGVTDALTSPKLEEWLLVSLITIDPQP